jgi:hypothetical protein
LDVVSNGYARSANCYPTQGFYAWRASAVDANVDLLNPEGLILDGSGNVIGVVYVTTAATAPTNTFGDANARYASTNLSAIGLTMPTPTTPAVTPTPGTTPTAAATPPAAVTTAQVLRVWLVSNAAGMFAATNANVTCPTGTQVTLTATPRPPPTGDFTQPWGLYLAIIGVAAVGIGVIVARRNMAKN